MAGRAACAASSSMRCVLWSPVKMQANLQVLPEAWQHFRPSNRCSETLPGGTSKRSRWGLKASQPQWRPAQDPTIFKEGPTVLAPVSQTLLFPLVSARDTKHPMGTFIWKNECIQVCHFPFTSLVSIQFLDLISSSGRRDPKSVEQPILLKEG